MAELKVESRSESGPELEVKKVAVTEGTDEVVGVVEDIYIVDRAMEKKMLQKFDWYIMPALSVMYLFNSIDKSNLGNAKTDGMDKDLHLVGNQYNIMQSVYYVPFVLTGPPMNLVTKKFGAARVLPASAIMFGAMAMISAGTSNFGGIVTTRWFLGMAESGFFAGVIYYLSTFYTRKELATRFSIFYAWSVAAGAFTGLISYGVFQITTGPLKGWQYLFLIEGALTVLSGIFAWFILPTSSATAYFLNDAEKKLAYHRMAKGSSTSVDVKFNFRKAMRVFVEDRMWPFYMFIGFCVDIPHFSLSNWLPQIVQSLGYSTIKTNLYTVAPNLVGAVFLVAAAFSSDYTGDRALHIAVTLCMTFVGFTVLAAVDVAHHVGVGYFCCFLICCGGFVSSPLLASWYANNTPEENQRALLTATLAATANAMGLVSSNLFLDKDAPQYTMASAVSGGFAGLGCILATCVGLYMKFDNMRRDRIQGVKLKPQDVPTSALVDGQKSLSWRWLGGIP
ncbi:hypothetical protein A1O1_04642 [Capronia coronata CBS 617.96]|uniref:Major facilitator superfamily (MFS) profile domain-containing protein n=1 Tax=Capronia coronata CBS 617.96 TaxID=1182541 RepID=W9Y4G2_9EURO|nr:uncharacterized protein A1O1_04642 [Capronia coronata CBS 617.96]EXJ87717.1 hypothetical protein A1O1_04642 [Capronia coronata CBS 617.96]